MTDLTKIKTVHEVINHTDANKYLKVGWKLICTAGGMWPESQQPYIKYSLGWDAEAEPIIPKMMK